MIIYGAEKQSFGGSDFAAWRGGASREGSQICHRRSLMTYGHPSSQPKVEAALVDSILVAGRIM
jgi:hypothetical protein